MDIERFDYPLPEERIALFPCEPRDYSRLLVVDQKISGCTHHRFYELGDFLRPGDLLIGNDTRVIRARLFGKTPNAGEIEIFLIKELGPLRWLCLAKPGKRAEGKALTFPENITGSVTKAGDEYEIKFGGITSERFMGWLDRVGSVALPPYIKRETVEKDKESYQTMFAQHTGSVAAPTAGLHFTPKLTASLKEEGVAFAFVTLHVGYGTFAPIRVEQIESHKMHTEIYSVPESTQELIRNHQKAGGRIIAIGTTALRALESWIRGEAQGETDLFLKPGDDLKVVNGLITNFHVPRSSLFVLICAILGVERAQEVYREALEEEYRFLSYGDAMLIL